MAKINNTTTFPIVGASDIANGDLLIGTDVSDTTNDADGETKNFRIGDLRGSMTLITSAQVSTAAASVDISSFIDGSAYVGYKLYFENATVEGSTFQNLRLQGSSDGFSTTAFNEGLGNIDGVSNTAPESMSGVFEFGNLAFNTTTVSAKTLVVKVSDSTFSATSSPDPTAPFGEDPITELRFVTGSGDNIETIDYYLYGIRNT